MKDRIERNAPFLLAIVLAVALALRMWSISFGLPYTYHIDERSYVIGALNLGQGEITGYPQQVGMVNILLGEYAAYFLVGRLVGWFSSAQDLARAYYVDPTPFYLLGRLTSTALGVVSCWGVYRLGKELRDRTTGLIAALFVAVNFLHVRESHFTTPDVAQGLGLVAVVLLCLRSLNVAKLRYLYIASFLAGVVTAWKWASFPVILPLIFTAWQVEAGKPFAVVLKCWVTCGLITVLGFAVFSPQLLLFPALYIEWAKRDYIAGSVGGYGGFLIDNVPGWLFYLKTSYIGAGALGLGLALAGLLLWVYRLARRQGQQLAVLLLFFVGYFYLMASSRRYFVRYAVPMVPFLSLAAADVLSSSYKRWATVKQRLPLVTLVAVVLLAVVQPALSSVRVDALWARDDTRTIAKEWVEQNIPEGAKIATDWMVHGVPLQTYDVPSPGSHRTYEVIEVNGSGLSDHPLEFYRVNGFDYLITTGYISELDLVDLVYDASRDAFYRSLDTTFELVQEFRPYTGDVEPPFLFDHIYGPLTSLWQLDQPGPRLKIFRVR